MPEHALNKVLGYLRYVQKCEDDCLHVHMYLMLYNSLYKNVKYLVKKLGKI